MSRSMIALSAGAVCALAAALSTPADAGMRFGGGIRFRPFFFQPHFSSPSVYSRDDEDRPSRRKKIVRSKPEKSSAPKTPLVKFADGTGRQYDPGSKVWFDGKSQCYSGKEAFTYKAGAWRYGSSRWALEEGAWKTSAELQPELVSCDSVPAFAAKARSNDTKAVAGEPAKAATPPAAAIKTADGRPEIKPGQTPAKAECKKYFASVGQMLTVPCSE